jgi:glycosyltransferase involved in cell wall biosynthesis
MTAAPLRLGLVGPVPPPNGGMAMQTAQLARLLAAEAVEVTFVPTNAPYRPSAVAAIPGLRSLFRLVPYLLAVWRLAGRVDVIHLMANSGWSWQLFAAPVLWLSRFRGTPVIVNYRGGEAQGYFQRSFRWVRPSLRRASLIVVPSGYLQAVFGAFGETTRVIPNIIDQDVFRERPDTSPSLLAPDGAYGDRESFTLVITRNLEPIYGIDTALQAMAKVREQGCPARMRIAGSGPAERQLRRLTRELGLEDIVHFEGRLERDAVVALYGQADAMVNPTTIDNMPNSVLEAMACGLPVISTNVGGVPYILTDGETGLLVPTRDPRALANAILRLFSDRALQQRLQFNALKEVDRYSWHHVRDQWLTTYHEVFSGKTGVVP